MMTSGGGGLFWAQILAALLAGILAISAWIASKKPEAKEALDKIANFRGPIGIGLVLFGLWNTFQLIMGMKGWLFILAGAPVFALSLLCMVVIGQLGLGFIHGYEIIAKNLGKNEATIAKAEKVRKKLMPLTTIFGFIAVISCLLLLVMILGKTIF